MAETFGWLIEHGDSAVSAPQYWIGCGGEAGLWSADHLAAVRFCRREDASRVAATIPCPTRVCEHGWL